MTDSDDQKEAIYRMFSPLALKIANPYLDEEEIAVTEIMSNIDSTNLIVIGGGYLKYLPIAAQYSKRYIVIDNHLSIFINDSIKYLLNSNPNIALINKKYEDLRSADLPSNNSLYIFTFNVISYINDPVYHIKRLIKKGDVVFISSWNPGAQTIFEKYTNHVFNTTNHPKIDIDLFVQHCRQEALNVTRIEGTTIDITIIRNGG